MWLSLSLAVLDAATAEPPAGGLSPLAWLIISVLAGVCASAIPALWYRGIKIQDKMYEDLKICNDKRAQTEEDVLGLMKVVRVDMERSRGGRQT